MISQHRALVITLAATPPGTAQWHAEHNGCLLCFAGALLMIGAAGVFWWHARKRKRKSTPGLEQQQGGPKPPAGTALLKADPGQSHVQPVADQAAQAWAR